MKLYELEMVEVDDITKNDPNPKEVDGWGGEEDLGVALGVGGWSWDEGGVGGGFGSWWREVKRSEKRKWNEKEKII